MGSQKHVMVESSWNVMAHGDAGRGSEGETGEWSRKPVPFTLPRNMVYPALLPLMRTPRLPVVDRTDPPAHLNGLVRFAERRNLVSARVPSHFKRSLGRFQLSEWRRDWVERHRRGFPNGKWRNGKGRIRRDFSGEDLKSQSSVGEFTVISRSRSIETRSLVTPAHITAFCITSVTNQT